MPALLGRTVLGRLLASFASEWREQRWLLIASFAALGAEVFLKSLEPWPLKWVIDSLVGGVRPGGWTPATVAIVAGGGLVAIVAGRALATYGATLGFSTAGNRLLAAIRIRLVDHLHRLSLSFHHRSRSGDLAQRVGRDTDLLKDVLVSALFPLVGNFVTLVVLASVMVAMQWQLAVVALAVLPVFGGVAMRVIPRIRQVARSQRRREGAAAAALTESLGAIRDIQAMALGADLAKGTKDRESATARDDVRGRVLAARLERSVDILTAIASGSVLVFGTVLVSRGAATVGDLVVFLAYLKSAYKPLQDVAKYGGRIAKALVAGERVLEILDQAPEIADRADAIEVPSPVGAIRFEDVRFGYTDRGAILDGVSFELSPGESVALMGPSGHGKTTIASLLLRLYEPTEGTITFDGRPLADYRLASLRRQMAFVPQDGLLFGISIRQNLLAGNPTATAEAIEDAARLVNAHDFIAKLPQGYDTVLSERGATVSAGQRQRIGLVRAALRDARVLILDEPTTGLDPVNRRIVIDGIMALTRTRTTLLITHDTELADRATRSVWLESGVIREEPLHAVTR